MSTLLYLLTLTGILAIGLTIATLVAGVFLYLRYRLTVEAAQQVNALIEANRATPRPGMATPDPRFHVVGGRDRGAHV